MKFRFFGLLLAFGVMAAAEAASAAPVTWRFYGLVPPTHDHAKQLMAAFARIDAATKGEFKVRFVYYGETPFKGGDALVVLRDGQVEMTEWMPTFSVGTYPLLATPEMPFIVPESMSAAEGTKRIDRAWEAPVMKSTVQKIIDDHGGRVLARYYYEPANFWFNEPVHNLEGFKGKRIRVHNPELGELAARIGAIPINVGYQDVYSALQRGTLNAVITGVGSLAGAKWDEVLRSGSIANFQYARAHVLVSPKKLAELSPEHQKVLIDEMAKLNEHMRTFLPESNASKLENLKKSGFHIVDMSQADYAKLRDITATYVWPAWKQRAGAGADALLDEVLKAASQ
jgi:TRAP-type C4-dicarboxylate transport system substrate-binding protein